ncbi:hypothetical protein ACH5RR_023618 [Cinchona calisaya]|uniref:Uncharacterized protein n=1 Tax=Cinchona calisaya TaxID=153742 RepID=A0ABD2ZD23_9GENT
MDHMWNAEQQIRRDWRCKIEEDRGKSYGKENDWRKRSSGVREKSKRKENERLAAWIGEEIGLGTGKVVATGREEERKGMGGLADRKSKWEKVAAGSVGGRWRGRGRGRGRWMGLVAGMDGVRKVRLFANPIEQVC